MFFRPLFVLAAISAVFAMPVLVSAQAARTTVAPARDGWKIRAPANDTIGLVLRQDLFDRNNSINLRSDYSGPPAQPGAVR